MNDTNSSFRECIFYTSMEMLKLFLYLLLLPKCIARYLALIGSLISACGIACECIIIWHIFHCCTPFIEAIVICSARIIRNSLGDELFLTLCLHVFIHIFSFILKRKSYFASDFRFTKIAWQPNRSRKAFPFIQSNAAQHTEEFG